MPADALMEVMAFLREDPAAMFEQLCDLTCVDYLNFPGARDRFGVVYSLLSISLGIAFRERAPEVPVIAVVGAPALSASLDASAELDAQAL